MNGFIVDSNLKAVRALLDQEPDEVNRTYGLSLSGYTALITAARYNQVAILQLLLERQADPTLKDMRGKTALEWAQEYNYTQAVEVLTSAHSGSLKETLSTVSSTTGVSDLEVGGEEGDANMTAEEKRYAAVFEREAKFPLPVMSIAILVVGTYGDVSPFCALGRRLAADGHRVRVASHAEYRQHVVGEGLEFYPLAGDPKELSEFMVKTGGKLLPDSLQSITVDIPRKMEVMRTIVFSVWPACTAPDPDAAGPGQAGPPFVADAIISNPPVFGHIHAAEALMVPLHLMFPQPWVPTRMYPHPMACLDKNRHAFSYTNRWSMSNYQSYRLVDELMWGGMAGIMNDFRLSLRLDALQIGDGGSTYITDCRVPFAHMWSPSFVPKAPDWGPEVDVVGNFFAGTLADVQYTPEPVLEKFLAAGPRPILVTFGSMKFDNAPEVCAMIYEAAGSAGVRVLIQSGWSELKCDTPPPQGVLTIGRAPHEWLMQRTAAVVHHGGAGTTAAGLRCGNPTLVCPFFGDQHFWGAMVERAGVGPAPCPIDSLTSAVLVEKFQCLMDPQVQDRAQAMGLRFAEEDGVRKAVASFYKHLPRSHMVCAVCVARGVPRPRIARWGHKRRLCGPCKGVVEEVNFRKQFSEARFKAWGPIGPRNSAEGLAGGTAYLTAEALGGVADLFLEPKKAMEESGREGLAKGIGMGLLKALWRPTKGAGVLLDKMATGAVNQFRGPESQWRDIASSAARKAVFGEIATGLRPADPKVDFSAEERLSILHAYAALGK
eukprot:GGOE01062264.1.p1 GENE.GGOE01062264.1~~GGOE01062264.1.p1  ORF type:complete len:784 (-),score=205.81 GGOE01062264.1:520-2838(-)